MLNPHSFVEKKSHSNAVSHRTFVNGRGRDVIMQDMRRRIDRGDFDKEVEYNIQVCQLQNYLNREASSLSMDLQ